MPKCIYCEKDFVIKPIGRPGGWNRQLCYDCLPEGCNKKDKSSAAKSYLKLRAMQGKLDRGCDICGYNKNGWALEWHHPNDDKEYNPSNLLQGANRQAWELYQKEIKKCQLLCANCHREVHSSHFKPFKKPQGTDEYEKLRQQVKETYLKTNNLIQTSREVGIGVDGVKSILEFFNIPILNPYGGQSKKIEMLDKNTEEVIREFNSITEAATYMGKNKRGSHIGDVCNGKRKTACGYKWRFV